MKKIVLLALAIPAVVFAQSYPSPTFNSLTLQNPLTAANGGLGINNSSANGVTVFSGGTAAVTTTPNLGTPSAVTLTNGTGLPISTGVAGLGTGVAAGLGNAATGSGSVVLSNSPALTTPNLGTPSAATLTNATGLPLTGLVTQAANTVVANVTGSTASPTAFAMPSCSGANNALRWTLGAGFSCASSIALTSSTLAQFAATTSAQLAGVISDETGSGSLVFGTSPTISTPAITGGSINNATVGATTPSTGSFTTLAASGAVSGTGFSNYLASPPAIGGATPNTIAATAFNQSNNLSGTPSANCTGTIPSTNYCVNYWTLGASTFDNANVGAGFVNGLALLHNYGGSSAYGGRQTFYVQSTLASPTNSANTNRNYVAAEIIAQAASGDGGTGTTSSTAQGGIFALSPVAVAYTGATNLLELTGAEVNTQAETGSSMYYKAGWTIVQTGLDAVQGSTYDAGMGFSNQVGAVGWQNGILFGPMNGQFPVTSTGCLICSTGSGIIATGIDFSSLTMTNFLHGPGGFYVNGAGDLYGPAASFSGPVSLAYTNPSLILNDTSGSAANNIDFQKNGATQWGLSGSSSAGTLTLQRYVGGTFTDNPISVSNSTGVVSFADGVAGVTSGSAASCSSGLVGSLCTNTTSGTSLTNNTPANATSVSLPAGDWDVQCNAEFVSGSGATATSVQASVGTTSATLGGLGQNFIMTTTFAASTAQWVESPVWAINVSSTTTAYCPVQSSFSGGTMTVSAMIRARRMR